MTTPVDARVQLNQDLFALLGRAHEQGLIITVVLQPTYPLRMGGYFMKGEIRTARPETK